MADVAKAEMAAKHVEEAQTDLKNVHPEHTGGDRAANLIGNQHIELTEEDVSVPYPTTEYRH